MPLNLGANVNDPAVMNQAVQQGLQYLAQLMQGPQGVPTMQTRQFAQSVANQLGGAFGSAYDDSWVKNYLGYGNQGAGLDLQRMQMNYAGQRADNTGNFDSSWMPALQAPTGAPTMQQRDFALDWGNTMGKNITPGQEAMVAQYVTGSSPVLQGLQQQYVKDLYSRGGGWNPNLVTAQAPGGTPTAGQFLNNLDWEATNRAMQGQAFNPAAGGWSTSPAMQQAMAATALQTVPQETILGAIANALNGALDKVFGGGKLETPKNDAASAARASGMGGFRQTEAAVQPQWTAKDNRDVEALKATAQGMDYASFIRELNRTKNAGEISSHAYDALKLWAASNMQ
jgi:hypothetical protein